jgi:hypothetical protein
MRAVTKDPARDAAYAQELRTIRNCYGELRLLPFATVDKQDLQTETAFGARRTVAMQSGGLSSTVLNGVMKVISSIKARGKR